MENEGKEGLLTAINTVMHAVGYVQKQRASGLNYSFAGEAALIAALRPAMVENGLTLVPVGMTILFSEGFSNTKGTLMHHVRVGATYRLSHAPTGEREDLYAIGEAIDAGDKACNKAMTGAYKYALRQGFMIETGDDPDENPSENYERKAPAPPPPSPTATPAQAKAATNPKDPKVMFAGEMKRIGMEWADVVSDINRVEKMTYPMTCKFLDIDKGLLDGFYTWMKEQADGSMSRPTGSMKKEVENANHIF